MKSSTSDSVKSVLMNLDRPACIRLLQTGRTSEDRLRETRRPSHATS